MKRTMKLNLKKRFAVYMLISALLLTACSSNQDSSSAFVNWLSYNEGLQAAGTQGKKTFLYFRADW